jgi:ribosomal protein S27AE
LDKLEELEMKYSKPIFTKRKTCQLMDLLLAHHQTPIPDILHTYKLSKNEIRSGVFCPDCETIPMDYYSANWHCAKCGFTSKNSHVPTVDDYFLLMGPTMTRKQFADFAHHKSINVAGKQLRALNLPSIGINRGTKYTLPKNQLLCPLREKEITEYTIPTR